MYCRRASNHILMLNNFRMNGNVISSIIGIVNYLGWSGTLVNLTLRFWDRGLLYAILTGTPDPSTSVRTLAD